MIHAAENSRCDFVDWHDGVIPTIGLTSIGVSYQSDWTMANSDGRINHR